MSDEAERLAMQIWSIARTQEQCTRLVPDESIASEVRERVRRLALQEGVKIRTARLGDTVVVVRLDAQVWNDDTATMRRKLAAE